MVIIMPHIKPTEWGRRTTRRPAMSSSNCTGQVPSRLTSIFGSRPRVRQWVTWNMGGETFICWRRFEADAANENYEISYSRGIPAGEYIVNVRNTGRSRPAHWSPPRSWLRPHALRGGLEILTTDVELFRQGRRKPLFASASTKGMTGAGQRQYQPAPEGNAMDILFFMFWPPASPPSGWPCWRFGRVRRGCG